MTMTLIINALGAFVFGSGAALLSNSNSTGIGITAAGIAIMIIAWRK